MVALNFAPEFADDVARRIKCQSIRQTRRANIGDRLQLYTGQRTKACRKLTTEDPVCVFVGHVAIRRDSLTLGSDTPDTPVREAFARLDGFEDYAAMYQWFSTRYGKQTFIGWLHRWHWPTPGSIIVPFEDPRPLAVITVDVRRDWEHFENLAAEVLERLKDEDGLEPCPCGDDDGNWCSLPGCPYPRPNSAIVSSGGDHG